ncbi:hypothetical protein [Caenispirillum salinarum]|uniref:hypothetical protein n=1 Tax=Caenispirillum salinarum TaxID=859058 RepID=UPI001360B4F9|nr:hypothetical protein [Caenispirillum salinarum]
MADGPGTEVCNDVVGNRLTLRFHWGGAEPDALTEDIAARLNATGTVFVRTTRWKGRTVLRLSITSGSTSAATCERLVTLIGNRWMAGRGAT